MQNYRIGVLLSAYNGEKYITQQIESIMKQKNSSHITLLVRNDGSTDNTLNIIQRLAEKYSNIVIIDGKNIGLIRSFFSLLKIAVSKYDFDFYSFSDQDDYWKNDKLENAVSYLKQEEEVPVLYGCTSIIVDNKLKPTGFKTQLQERNITFFNSAIQNIIPGHNQVLNKKLATILVNQPTNYSKIYSQDLWIINVAAIVGKIIFDNTPHTLYRMHGNNELGYGTSKSDRIIAHLKRLNKKEPKKIATQLYYFYECYEQFLTIEQKKELISFFRNQKKFTKRLKYINKTRLYRQNSKETILFKILYLFKQYNI
jgi:rhamnosyltransferase